ncbi:MULTISPECIES: TorF family putative porin [Sphingomonas]|uniref:TorF family putative porin n=1 Tax=Sphingomonas kyungheensis TaxID=1069987 RepID=A0ABU8GZ48_9SPHN|nr:TorF family putative porin [Sphingomonas sp. CV7422]
MKYLLLAATTLAAVTSMPAAAQDTAPPKAVTVSGNVALVSDYRLRGVSQTDKEGAVQGGITIAHESGVYVGTWASNLAGWGTFGGSNMELDLIGGYKHAISGGAIDVGLTWYMYPGGASKTDFAEPYAKLSGTIGPVNLLAGVAYAPKQEALGKWYNSGADYATGVPNRPGKKNDNLYLWGDFASAIPTTPFTAKAHIGYSKGNSGLGPNGTSVAPTGEYWDWLLGADYAIKGTPLTLGVAYVDTDITKRQAAYLQPNFSSTKNGSSIAASQVVFALTAAF